MVQIENLPLVLTGLGLTASILYYTMTLRNANKTQQQQLDTRQAQLFMGIHQEMMSSRFINAEKAIWNTQIIDYTAYSKALNDENFYEFFQLIGYWLEGIGVLVHDNLIDVRLPSMLYSGLIIGFWDKFGGFIKKDRENFDFPRRFIECEYLANKVESYGREHPELKIKQIDTMHARSHPP